MRWTSGGAGDFEVETINRPERGTSVTLHLRDDAADYLSTWKLKSIINKYSDHISLPILMRKEEWKEGEEGKGGEMVLTDEWETVNQASALWSRPKKDISPEQYQEFYKQISHDHEAPLAWAHNRVEGSTEFIQLLYIPAHAPFDLWNREKAAGVKLYVKRVFIMDEAEALLPAYLRFVKGVIDSSDLPLNVSRELLQESRDVKAIREGSTKRVLGMLEDLAKHEKDESATDEDKGKYAKFYAEFGSVLKEGLGEDFANRERLAKLLRFASTSSDAVSVSLADYKARMKEGQEAIYYITADTHGGREEQPAARGLPQEGHRGAVDDRPRGRVGAQLPARVRRHADAIGGEGRGRPGQAAGRGREEGRRGSGRNLQARAGEAAGSAQGQGRRTCASPSRLVDSPACLVVSDGGMSMQLSRMLKQAGQKVPEVKPVLEVNAEHPLVKKLEGSAHFEDLAHILFDQALLAEGGLPEDPAAYVRRVNALLV